MARLNLLPASYRQGRRQRRMRPLCLAVGVVLIGAMAMLGFRSSQQLAGDRQELIRLTDELVSVQPVAAKLQALIEEELEVNSRLAILVLLEQEQIPWMLFLQKLEIAISPGISLEGIFLEPHGRVRLTGKTAELATIAQFLAEMEGMDHMISQVDAREIRQGQDGNWVFEITGQLSSGGG